MTIAEVHLAAAKEQAEKSAAAAQSARESISRGGSRTGHARRDGPGEWQAVNTGVRPLQRPGDFSNLGRNLSSAGMPSAPTFGPSSVFNKGKKAGVPGVVTPPISRQASTSNMNSFSALQGDVAETPDQRGSGEPEPQRRKIQLAPRTRPIPGEGEADGEADAEADGEAGDADETASEDEVATPAEASTAVMSPVAVKTKIEADMRELWGEKDTGGSRNADDIVEYFKSLPLEHQPKLAERLVDDVFRISKTKDAEVVAKGWTATLEQNAATTQVLQKG
jgi:translation initiation factor 4G